MKLIFELIPSREPTEWELADSGATLKTPNLRFPHKDKFFSHSTILLFKTTDRECLAGFLGGPGAVANLAFYDGLAIGLRTEDGTPNSQFTLDSIYEASGYWWDGKRRMD